MKILRVFDYEKCIGCKACEIACKLENNLPPFPSKPIKPEVSGPKLIEIIQIGPEIRDGKVIQKFIPKTCRHCLKAPCMENCPVGAIERGEFGEVEFLNDKCIGCGVCLEVCPFEAPQMMPNGSFRVCNLCSHRLRKGQKPACIQACPAECIFLRKI